MKLEITSAVTRCRINFSVGILCKSLLGSQILGYSNDASNHRFDPQLANLYSKHNNAEISTIAKE